MCEDSWQIPYRHDIPNLKSGDPYYIEPVMVNTMAKILPTDLAH